MRVLVSALVTLFLLIPTAKADNFNCLVEALYHEARSESMLAMLSVANVILTRKESSNFPNTICKVVHLGKYWKGNPIKDKCHFSYWCDGRPERFTDIEGLIKSINVAEMSLKGIQHFNSKMEASEFLMKIGMGTDLWFNRDIHIVRLQ